ncbi:MAG: yiaD [Ignavibacteria bacterium]|nr:yiaD [Ignavibacteria bacterium]
MVVEYRNRSKKLPPFSKGVRGFLFNLLFLIFILLFNSFHQLQSQMLSFTGVNSGQYPKIKSRFLAMTQTGITLPNLSINNVHITEGNKEQNIVSVTCPTKTKQKAISAVLTFDISGSMVGLNHQSALAAGYTWLDALDLSVSECAITSFNTKNYLNSDFTNDKRVLNSAINTLEPAMGAGTNFNAGFVDTNAGALRIAEKGVNKRIVVFLTDGQAEGNEDSIVNKAIAINAVIYCVTLGMGIPPVLQHAAERTGGKYFDKINSLDEAKEAFFSILIDATEISPCEVEWNTQGCDMTKTARLSIDNFPLTAIQEYSVPEDKFTYYKFSPSANIDFGLVSPGSKSIFSIQVTAVNGDLTITDLKASNPKFQVIDWGGTSPTFSLNKDESRTIKIEYSSQDSAFEYCLFTIESDACFSGKFTAYAGLAGMPPLKPTLKLLKPNGGEKFLTGADTIIIWEGISPSDKVTLKYSIDSGNTWKHITDTANELKYIWNNIPDTPSDKCLIRVNHNLNPDSKPWLLNITAKSENASGYAITADRDDYVYVTGSFINTIDFGEAGKFLTNGNQDFFLAKYNPNGEVIWAKHAGEAHNDRGSDIIVSDDGSIYVTGRFQDNIDFGNGVNLSASFSYEENLFLAKYSADGDCQWAHIFHGSCFTCSNGLAFDGAGNILVCGEFVGPTDFGNGIRLSSDFGQDIFIAKYDINGNCIWARQFGTEVVFEFASGLNVSFDGTIYLAGSGGIILVFDSNGVLKDNFSFSTNSEFCQKIVTDASGYIYLANNSSLSKCKRDTLIWTRNIGRNNGYSNFYDYNIGLSIDANSNIYWARGFKGAIALDSIITLASTNIDGFLSVYDTSGKCIMFRQVGGTGNEVIFSLFTDKKGNIYTTGTFSYIADFGTAGKLQADSTAPFLWKINSQQYAYLADQSDTLFSIIAPNITLLQADLGKVLVGTTKDTIINDYIYNDTPLPIVIDSINFIGGASKEFAIVSGAPPFTIDANSYKPVEFSFRPSTAGTRTTGIKIWANNYFSSSTLSGEGILPSLEIVHSMLDFDTLRIGTKRDTVIILLKNTGLLPINIDSTILLGPDTSQFLILGGGGSFSLPQNGGERTLKVEFAPENIGRTSGRIGFFHNSFGSPAIVDLFGIGTGVIGTATLRIDTIYSKTNEAIELKIYLDEPVNILESRASAIRANIKFNSTLMVPIKNTSNGSISESARIIPIDIPIKSTVPNILTTLYFRTTLGNAEETIIEPDSVQSTGGKIVFKIIPGKLILNNICHQGGTRLIMDNGIFDLSAAYPNPSDNLVSFEYNLIDKGNFELAIYNLFGTQVAVIDSGEKNPGVYSINADIGSLSSGSYFAILKTPFRTKLQRLEIIR